MRVMRREVPLLPNLVRSYFWPVQSGSSLRTLMDNCESGMEGTVSFWPQPYRDLDYLSLTTPGLTLENWHDGRL